MNQKEKIDKNTQMVWEAYVDPLHSNLEKFPSIILDHRQEIQMEEEEEGELEQEDTFPAPIFAPRPTGILNTKFGLLSIMDHTMACNAFDVWILHTKFDINEEAANLIEKCPGVETLEILTRYRCKIGFNISGLFNNTEVKKNIEKLLVIPDGKSELEKLKDTLSIQSNKWVLYIGPGDQVFTAMGDSVKNKSKLFKSLHQRVGGTLLTSDEN